MIVLDSGHGLLAKEKRGSGSPLPLFVGMGRQPVRYELQMSILLPCMIFSV